MIWLLYARSAILRIFKYARSVILRIFKYAIAYPWQAALIAALCLAGWLYMGKQDAQATISKRDATIVAMTKASEEARAAQIALNKANTDKQTEIARKADNDETIRRDIADRSRAYADRMRAGAYCRKASATTQDSVAEVDTSASDTSVVVSADDFRTLTGNTARLVSIKAWGDRLIGEGLAVPYAPEQP
jgi:hypothetical protein